MEYVIIFALSIAIIVMALIIVIADQRIRFLQKQIKRLAEKRADDSLEIVFNRLFSERQQNNDEERKHIINKLTLEKVTGWTEESTIEELRMLYKLFCDE